MCQLAFPVEPVEGCPLVFNQHVPIMNEPDDSPPRPLPRFTWAQFWREISQIQQEEELEAWEDCYLEFQDIIENGLITWEEEFGRGNWREGWRLFREEFRDIMSYHDFGEWDDWE